MLKKDYNLMNKLFLGALFDFLSTVSTTISF